MIYARQGSIIPISSTLSALSIINNTHAKQLCVKISIQKWYILMPTGTTTVRGIRIFTKHCANTMVACLSMARTKNLTHLWLEIGLSLTERNQVGDWVV
jgi:hypothetical protein